MREFAPYNGVNPNEEGKYTLRDSGKGEKESENEKSTVFVVHSNKSISKELISIVGLNES